MAVFGLVLTLVSEPRRQRGVRERLAADPRICLGEGSGARLPVVLELERRAEGSRTAAELATPPDPVTFFADWPEVVHVDLAFAHLGESST